MRSHFTLVSFHAHPDDEALFTGGTLARAAQHGHRVVLVVATAGEAGLAQCTDPDALAADRGRELQRSAQALGVARVVTLNYPDSGFGGSRRVDGLGFADLDPDGPAGVVAEILRSEQADAITVYDPLGGYGHPDHRQVYRVGVRAARLAGTRCVLEATLDRGLISAAVGVLRLVPGLLDPSNFSLLAGSFTGRDRLTHRVDVRPQLDAKLAALAAHASQAQGGDSVRTLALLLGLPGPVQSLVLGHEWFVDRSRPPGRCDDVFASLRQR
jgi:LmbE family N-acetylglucosaminyl deacetylase